MSDADPRITPARPDIAASHLKGQVDAKRFVDGVAYRVATGHAALRRSPNPHAEQVSQALFGETFTAYETGKGRSAGWAWGQLEADGYVGWMALSNLSDRPLAATHRVGALRTIAFAQPDLKSHPLMALSMNARTLPGGETSGFLDVEGAGWIFARHLARLDDVEPDFVAVAERFVGSPYLWGGRESAGIDCSGLVQASLAAAGVAAPRDSDMQAASLGKPIDPGPGFSSLRRGDLVFWTGHVGIMLDADRLLHANAWHMAVDVEPLADAIARIEPAAGSIKTIRRI
jgi:cell wall-associated NlpC family hydrolase